ncbi:phage tail tube protein [Nocardioides sp. T2.26MG-1]|uniref:phage tail tube protein n=1 Tax=Nocardioides sp. T2.26MG-1 TaxID=3041166 RepID=UPI00247763CD|nr:hypothetical protein [Nocardioides sp. T2.26MG-1]CAI9417280.1 hypothetical protein HIDPHFAB_02981 [Nocardioides sp. T2.26MG-1]
MSRRTHACLTCAGHTRHDDQVCAACRRAGHSHHRGVVRLTLLADVADPLRPTRVEIEAGVDLTAALLDVKATWRGTDTETHTYPGRYA